MPVVQVSLWKPMPDSSATVFRQRICRAAGCGAEFWICRSCDRGQCYCSQECREQSRRAQCREANSRHQQSPEGRLDHRDRQRAYRKRCVLARVTDQGRQASGRSARMGRIPPLLPAGPVSTDLKNSLLPSAGWKNCLIYCSVCGQLGYLSIPFAKRAAQSQSDQ